MSEVKVDARGMVCPKPLIMVKKALAEAAVGDSLLILIDNETANENVLSFLRDNGCQPSSSMTDKDYIITTSRQSIPLAAPTPAMTGAPDPGAKKPVLAIHQNGMGKGSDELGKILIQACLNTIKDISPLPGALVFYNSGVQLACEGSPVLASLEDLQRRGVKILACGTCLDYFQLKKSLKVGKISNMLDILQTMASASHVIAP